MFVHKLRHPCGALARKGHKMTKRRGRVLEGPRKSGIICEQPFISNKNNPRKKVDALLLPLSLKNIAHTQPLIPSPKGMGIYGIPSHSFNYQKESHDCN